MGLVGWIPTDNNTVTTAYREGFQYTDGNLEFFPHQEGYVKVNASSIASFYTYVFNYTDHLGNIRLRYTQHPQTGETQILEEDHYYPFGLKHRGYNQEHFTIGFDQHGTHIDLIEITRDAQDTYRYKFGGKEYQNEFDVNVYDFGARNYDPALGRWMNIDPLAEMMRRHSPYNYAFNNPVFFMDPDGMSPLVSMASMQTSAVEFYDFSDSIIVTGDPENVEAYKTEVSKGTGGFYTAEIDKNGQLDLISTGKDPEGMTPQQKAFYEIFCEIILNHDVTVQHDIVSNDPSVEVDNIITGEIDIKDAQQFDLAGTGGASTAGVLTHATVEQFEKIKAGYPTGVEAPSKINIEAHGTGIRAENKVNGNIRGFRNNENFYLESNGRVTTQLIMPNSGTIKVIKRDLGTPK